MPSSRSGSPTSRDSEAVSDAVRDPVRPLGPAVGALAFKLATAPWLVAQARQTRRHAHVLPEAAGPREGRLGEGHGRALRLLIVGDSSAAGVGVAEQHQAVTGHLTRALQRALDAPLEWHLRARSGLSTKGVHEMLRADPPPPADIAVVITGVNDVIGLVAPRRALAHRAALAGWLQGTCAIRHVVFAPLPPIERFPLLPALLRRVMGDDARRHDLALSRWAKGRDDVSHVEIELDVRPAVMASDGFHPGEPVYRICGEALALHTATTIDRLERYGTLGPSRDAQGERPQRTQRPQETP